jgi:hypothetical protein
MLRSDVGAQESAAAADDDYYPSGVCYFMEDADDQE